MKHTTTELILKNGSKGLLIDVPDASVMCFEFNFRAGDYLVPREKQEAPHLMEHILLGANERYPRARTFQAEFEKNGAYSNAGTGAYDITYEAECADFEWERVLDLMVVAITKPLFLPEEFRAEFGNVREEMAGRSNNHFRHLSLALREAYGFCAMPDQSRLELMDNVSLEDVIQHYKGTHYTKNMRFIVAGHLTKTRQEIIKERMEAFDLPSGQARKKLPIEVPKKLKSPLYIHKDIVDTTHFYIDTFHMGIMNDELMDALSLLNTMLTETLHSRILGAAREQGLIYHMSSGPTKLDKVTGWWIGAQVMPANATALFEIMVAELQSILRGDITDDDIEASKQYMLGRYQRSGQTVSGTASGYSSRYYFENIIDDYYAVPERIKGITKEAIVESARTVFEDKIWGIGVLGNCGKDFAKTLQDQISVLWK